MSSAVRANAARPRFELDIDGHVAFSNYKRDGSVLTILHTEVPAALNGKGIGSALVAGERRLYPSPARGGSATPDLIGGSRAGVIVKAPPPAARDARGCPPPQAGDGKQSNAIFTQR
jgi:hypothetical protein